MNLFFRSTLWMILVANAAWAQSILPEEYTYDANGNLASDANKDITGIHYNTLNLPDTITYADGRKIIYLYTATGQKIRQQVLRADGTLQTKRDYTGPLLYENNQLQQVQHDEGRVVMTGAQPEYQYHLKDHLGNVRMTVTSLNDPIEYLATMEGEQTKEEGAYFSNLPVRSPYPLANHTPGGHEVIALPPGSENIASLDLAVSSGDIIYLEAYTYYENGVASDPSPGNGGGEESLRQGTAALVSTALSAVLSGGLVAAEGVTQAVSGNATGALAITPVTDETLPVAYLNYELFDQNYTLVDGGFKKVTSQGAYNKELLAMGPIHVTQPGYVRVYLNNRSAKLAVYFDDLKVTHVRGPVVQEDSYDPFGMAIAGQHTEQYAAVANRHLYNGKELQNDHDLNWHDYGARMYDAALGRWHAIDPLSEEYASWSPYQYVMNNPLKFVDPDGKGVNVFRVDVKDRMDAFRGLAGLMLTQMTPEGARIFSEAHNNKNISVYLAFQDSYIKVEDGPTTVTGTTDYGKDYTNGVFSVPENDRLNVFNGLDLTEDINAGKEVYLVVVSVSDGKRTFTLREIALIIDHEVEAHVNISERHAEKITALLKKYPQLDEATIHHTWYGEEAQNSTFSGNMVFYQGKMPPHTTSAYRAHKQMSKISIEWLNFLESILKPERDKETK